MEFLHVEVYPGYKGELTPRAFTHDGVRLEVREILSRWYRGDMVYFRLQADDGYRYVLRHDDERRGWELVMKET